MVCKSLSFMEIKSSVKKEITYLTSTKQNEKSTYILKSTEHKNFQMEMRNSFVTKSFDIADAEKVSIIKIGL